MPFTSSVVSVAPLATFDNRGLIIV